MNQVKCDHIQLLKRLKEFPTIPIQERTWHLLLYLQSSFDCKNVFGIGKVQQWENRNVFPAAFATISLLCHPYMLTQSLFWPLSWSL